MRRIARHAGVHRLETAKSDDRVQTLAPWFVDWLGSVAVVGGDNAAELLVAAESVVRSWAEGSLQDLGLNARARFGRPSGQRVARTS